MDSLGFIETRRAVQSVYAMKGEHCSSNKAGRIARAILEDRNWSSVRDPGKFRDDPTARLAIRHVLTQRDKDIAA